MLTKTEVEKIAGLARLKLEEKEKEKFTEDLSSIIGYIQKLSEVNVEKVEPMTGGTDLESVARQDDETTISDPEMRKQMLNAAPNREEDYFKVPTILE